MAIFRQILKTTEKISNIVRMRNKLEETVVLGRASMRVSQRRPTTFLKDASTGLYTIPDPLSYVEVDEPEVVWNLITNAGRIFIHTQSYGTSGLGANGLNYIALSNDTVTETSTSTTLSNEITTNGLGRAQGTVVLPTGSGTQTTVDHTFTASGSQSCQKAALFTASSVGTMNHVLGFTQRSLISSDTIEITYTITVS